MAIRMITNVPAGDVDARIQFYADSGATNVQSVPERDGEFTLIVIYPDYERFGESATINSTTL